MTIWGLFNQTTSYIYFVCLALIIKIGFIAKIHKEWSTIKSTRKTIYIFILMLLCLFHCSGNYNFLWNEFQKKSLNSLDYFSKNWNINNESLCNYLSIAIGTIIEPLAILMFSLGFFLLTKNKNYILKIKDIEKTEDTPVTSIQINKNIAIEDFDDEIFDCPIIEFEDYSCLSEHNFIGQLNILAEEIEDTPVTSIQINKNIAIEDFNDEIFDCPIIEFEDYSCLSEHNFIGQLNILAEETEDTPVTSIQINENIEIDNLSKITEYKFIDNNKFSNSKVEVLSELDKDLETINKYVMEKYGMTQEEVANLERPGDYLLEGW